MRNDLPAYLLNLAVGIVTVVFTVVLLGCFAVELIRRPRFGLRSLLIALTVIAMFLGLVAASRP